MMEYSSCFLVVNRSSVNLLSESSIITSFKEFKISGFLKLQNNINNYLLFLFITISLSLVFFFFRDPMLVLEVNGSRTGEHLQAGCKSIIPRIYNSLKVNNYPHLPSWNQRKTLIMANELLFVLKILISSILSCSYLWVNGLQLSWISWLISGQAFIGPLLRFPELQIPRFQSLIISLKIGIWISFICNLNLSLAHAHRF